MRIRRTERSNECKHLVLIERHSLTRSEVVSTNDGFFGAFGVNRTVIAEAGDKSV